VVTSLQDKHRGKDDRNQPWGGNFKRNFQRARCKIHFHCAHVTRSMDRGEPMQVVEPRSSAQPRTTSIVLRVCARAAMLTIDERERSTMSKIVLVVFTSLVIAAGAADAVAQTAGSTVSVSKTEQRQIATGWSAKKQILGKSVYNNIGEKIGDINDLIVTPDKAVSYAIVGVGGFLGVGEREIAVPVGRLKQQEDKIVLPGATKDTLKAAPKFEYAK